MSPRNLIDIHEQNDLNRELDSATRLRKDSENEDGMETQMKIMNREMNDDKTMELDQGRTTDFA